MMKARFRSLAGPVHKLPPYQQKQQVESIAGRAGGADGRAHPRHHALRFDGVPGVDAFLVHVVEDGLRRRDDYLLLRSIRQRATGLSKPIP